MQSKHTESNTTLTPVSRTTMRKLYEQKQEAESAAYMNEVVQSIYRLSVKEATANPNVTEYKNIIYRSNDFYTPNRITEIVKRLQALFPECSVSKRDDPERGHLFYIVVDWS
jgi:hypothetical protein